ncbi:MAG: hypothetical protein ACI4I1_04925 [Oscillospiraceae bacterium]
MNMKKTIAAVAACAMAVSAMATTVSAVSEGATEAQKIHYDLTIKSKTKAADLTFSATNLTVGAGDVTGLAITVDTTATTGAVKGLSNDLTLVINNKTMNKVYEFKFTTDKGSANYDGTASKPAMAKKGAAADEIDTSKEVYLLDLGSTANGLAVLNALVGDVDITASISADTVVANEITDDWNDNSQKDLNDAIEDGDIKVQLIDEFPATAQKINGTVVYTDPDISYNTLTSATAAGAPVASTSGAFAGKTGILNVRGSVKEVNHIKPMKTNNNVATNNAGTADIFTQLATTGSRDYGKYYENASAVINDMIANYDEVVFTFNTAAQKVKDGEYSTAWDAKDYTKFPQQLYNLFGDENTGYVYANSPTYTFNNLFNAALVANKDLTMNQNAIAPFVYNATSVSFEWDTMTATGGQFVSAASAIRTLQLATSSEWYWDSMDVVGYTAAIEDTESQSPVEADEEDLDDTDAEIDETDDEDQIDDTDDTADVDDVDDTDDVDTDDTAADEGDAAADETTGNPETGNAPIALAVIPVALAAAAVVAKKRG